MVIWGLTAACVSTANSKNNLQQIKITPKRIINLNNLLAAESKNNRSHPRIRSPCSFPASQLQSSLLLLGGVLSAVNEIKCNVRGRTLLHARTHHKKKQGLRPPLPKSCVLGNLMNFPHSRL